MKINIWTLYSKLLISPLLLLYLVGPYILKTPFVFTSPFTEDPIFESSLPKHEVPFRDQHWDEEHETSLYVLDLVGSKSGAVCL